MTTKKQQRIDVIWELLQGRDPMRVGDIRDLMHKHYPETFAALFAGLSPYETVQNACRHAHEAGRLKRERRNGTWWYQTATDNTGNAPTN